MKTFNHDGEYYVPGTIFTYKENRDYVLTVVATWECENLCMNNPSCQLCKMALQVSESGLDKEVLKDICVTHTLVTDLNRLYDMEC